MCVGGVTEALASPTVANVTVSAAAAVAWLQPMPPPSLSSSHMLTRSAQSQPVPLLAPSIKSVQAATPSSSVAAVVWGQLALAFSAPFLQESLHPQAQDNNTDTAQPMRLLWQVQPHH